jgi:hypothetical protein
MEALSHTSYRDVIPQIHIFARSDSFLKAFMCLQIYRNDDREGINTQVLTFAMTTKLDHN